MKKLFIAMLAVATLASCSKDETLSYDKGEAIAFGNVFVDNATRAADPSYSANDISKFNVYGTVDGDGAGTNAPVVIYPGTEITKGSAAYGVAWTCGVNQYWVPGATYKFVGIVDGNKPNVTTTNLTDGMPTSVSYIADGVTDLLCQTIDKVANTNGQANGLVAFAYSHLLAKAKFTVVNESVDAPNYLHKITNLKVANAYKSATYDVVNNAWTAPVAADADGGQAFDAIVAKNASTESANEKLLIPGITPTVTFDLELYYVDGETETLLRTTPCSATATDTTLNAANAYNFNIKVKVGELIQFTVTEQPEWATVADTELN